MSDLSLKYLLLGEDKSASKAIRGVADTAEESSKKFAGVSKVWQAGAALAGAAVVKFGVDAVMAASDQDEALSKSSVIFGENAGEIEKWADTADKNLGLSKTAALDLASGFGDMFLQLGFAKGSADDMSKSVVGLAADLGSFNNLPTAEVADMISAAFRGEYDSLQRLVPNINAARVETEGLAMTGKKNASELTAQEKAAATLAIVTRDSARAHGDFARTSDGLANSLKIAQAAAANEAADLGQKLLPAVTAVVQGFTGALGVVGDTVDTMSQIPAPVYGAVAALVAWNLVGDKVEGIGRRVAGGARQVGDSLRVAGLYAREAEGRIGGLKAGLSALSGGLSAGQVATGGLKAAGAGLVGLLGGPWGIALAGATVAATAFAQAQANSRQDVESLTDTIDKQTGAFTELSRKFVAENFSFNVKPEDLAGLERMGIVLDDVTTAALGTNQQYEAMRGRLLEIANGNSDYTQAASGTLSALDNMRGKANEANAQFAVQKKLLGDTSTVTTTAAGSSDIFAGAVDGVAAAAAGAKIDMQKLNDQIAEHVQLTLTARGATRDYEEAIDDANDAVKENGKTLNVHTAAGRANQAALDNIASSALAVAEADLKQGKSTAAVTANVKLANDAFVNAAVKMGMKKDKAKALADQLGLTSGQVQTLTNKVNGVPAAKTTKVTVPTATATTQAQTIQDKIDRIRGKNVPVTISVFGLGTLQAAQGILGGIRGVAASVGRNADGTGNWRGGMTWINERGPELAVLPGGTAIYDAKTSAAIMSAYAGRSGGGGGGGDIYLTANLRAADGRIMQTELLRFKRQLGGGSLGFD